MPCFECNPHPGQVHVSELLSSANPAQDKDMRGLLKLAQSKSSFFMLGLQDWNNFAFPENSEIWHMCLLLLLFRNGTEPQEEDPEDPKRG